MSNSIYKLSEEEQNLILNFRKNLFDTLYQLRNDLENSGSQNPAFLILDEMSGIVGDIVYLIQSDTLEDDLKVNNCESPLELANLLCRVATNRIVKTVTDHNMTEIALEVEMQNAKMNTKQ